MPNPDSETCPHCGARTSKIRSARIAAGLTQIEIARLAGISQATMARLEGGARIGAQRRAAVLAILQGARDACDEPEEAP
jgi:transcriptional regulator with XRE-family HTH domain